MVPISTRLALIGMILFGSATLGTAAQQSDCHGDPLPEGAVARLGTLRLRHGDGVSQVAYSSDGKWMVSLGRDRTCRAWEANSGRVQYSFAEKDVDFYAVAFSPDSAALAVAGGDPFHGGNTSIRLIDLATGAVIARLN